MRQPRRNFLKQSGFILAGTSAGALNSRTSSSDVDPQQPSSVASGVRVHTNAASFGWEVQLNNNGADVYFPVEKAMILLALDVDTSLMIGPLPAKPGPLEILCTGSVSRGAPPKFANAAGPAYIPWVKSSDFGSVSAANPNKVWCNFNDTLAQDLFYSVILKAWVPSDGAASSTARHVRAEPSILLNKGDYVAFHMDHMGVPCNGEMQVVLNYRLA
jgi:hypothetical protein